MQPRAAERQFVPDWQGRDGGSRRYSHRTSPMLPGKVFAVTVSFSRQQPCSRRRFELPRSQDLRLED
jgi:hypothetical protein